MKKLNKPKEVESLNDELYSDFSINELEKRFETAAWLVCGVDCPELSCIGDDVEVELE